MTRPAGYRCVLCEHHFTEYGNSAEPLALGRCCNRCNTLKVIPARAKKLRAELRASVQLENKSTEGD